LDIVVEAMREIVDTIKKGREKHKIAIASQTEYVALLKNSGIDA